ncbi:MAG TPA: hypothetical protein VFO10_30660 [Oligoflexus sp.]|uniref:hypothetical protein n=1 Tax=Oligoflexus sp. TaxID=1971216 RepID=UPI002D7E671B|nr:hypothetical protein [Oligoflexus sp.]HET9241669.1 hypothetical protein [Oligoflexus sp.]
MTRYAFMLPGLLLPLALLACKKDEKTSETGRKLESTPAELRGTWQSGCMGTTTLNMASSQREYVFNAIGDFDRLERYYSDPNCQNLAATYKVVGTVEVKGPNPEKTDLNMINFTVNEAYMTVKSDATLEQLNAMKFCGRSDWHVNEDVHVTNAECEGSKVQKGGVQFDSFKIRDGQLFMGQKLMFLGKDDASERPAELDMRAPYIRK